MPSKGEEEKRRPPKRRRRPVYNFILWAIDRGQSACSHRRRPALVTRPRPLKTIKWSKLSDVALRNIDSEVLKVPSCLFKGDFLVANVTIMFMRPFRIVKIGLIGEKTDRSDITVDGQKRA